VIFFIVIKVAHSSQQERNRVGYKANFRAQLNFGKVAVIEYSGWYIMCANKEELNLYFSLASKRKKIHLIIKKKVIIFRF